MNKWLIKPDELRALNHQNCVIFDCRFALNDHNLGQALFAQGHIPDAFYLNMENDLSGPKEIHGGRHPVPRETTFSEKMRQCGVNNDTLVIAYDDNQLAGAARLWWLLLFFGHTQVKILNGGYNAWKAAGFEVSSENNQMATANIITGNFCANAHSELIVDHLWVRQHLGDHNVTFIDAREPLRYLGLEEPVDPVAGHIPGAINAPWQSITDSRGSINTVEQQQRIWRALPLSEIPVVYCGSGITACVNLLSLSIAGINNARLYAGSWSDWCSYPANPIEPPNNRTTKQ